jgi:hypothetical protein
MANIKITELPSATSITDNDLLVIVDSGNPYVTKKISWKDIDSPQDGIIYGRKNGGWTNANNAAKSIVSVSSFAGPNLSISTSPLPHVVRLASVYAIDLGGISAPTDCYELLIINVGSYAISIKHQMSAVPGNPSLIPPESTRIITQAGTTETLATGYSVRMVYDTVTQRWRTT